MKFTPVGQRLLVEPITGTIDKVRGLLIPEAYRDKELSIECIVANVGTKGPFEVKIGDRVLIERHRGTEVKIGNRMFKIVETTELLAVIE